jgi:hypothetical protein
MPQKMHWNARATITLIAVTVFSGLCSASDSWLCVPQAAGGYKAREGGGFEGVAFSTDDRKYLIRRPTPSEAGKAFAFVVIEFGKSTPIAHCVLGFAPEKVLSCDNISDGSQFEMFALGLNTYIRRPGGFMKFFMKDGTDQIGTPTQMFVEIGTCQPI